MIVSISEDNLDAIARQYIRAFDDAAWDCRKLKKRVIEYMRHPLFRGFALMEGDTVISAAFGILMQYYEGERLFLTDLFTAPEYQNMGYASTLLNQIKEQLQAESVTQIMLISENDALHNYFYDEKNGFETRQDLCIKRFKF